MCAASVFPVCARARVGWVGRSDPGISSLRHSNRAGQPRRSAGFLLLLIHMRAPNQPDRFCFIPPLILHKARAHDNLRADIYSLVCLACHVSRCIVVRVNGPRPRFFASPVVPTTTWADSSVILGSRRILRRQLALAVSYAS